MYDLSQQIYQAPVAQYGPLEQMTGSYVSSAGTIAYAATAIPMQQYSLQSFALPAYNLGFSTRSTGYMAEMSAFTGYASDNSMYQLFQTKPEYHFVPDNFLKPGKGGKFVGRADEVKEFVTETFEKVFNQPFPHDIKLSVLDEKEFRKLSPNHGTIGLSINRRKQGLLSEIFVLNGSLGRVLLTIGHELGHVLTETLSNAHDEEAKAYSFSFVWMDCIKQHNIAGLQDAIITEQPALNGLHDVAFSFVQKLKRQGRTMLEIYHGLITRMIAMGCGV